MSKIIKRIIAAFLCIVMVFGLAPINEFINSQNGFDLHAEAASTYSKGNIITFGSYPQSLVSSNESFESSYDKSKNSDCNEKVFSGGKNYKRYYFKSYNTYADTYGNQTEYTYQDDNGYYTNTPYWFAYEPIEWIVLDADANNTLTLISKDILDAHEFGANGSWSGSQIQNWLNTTFLNDAFSQNEQMAILNTSVSTETTDSVWFDVTAGGDTSVNKVFFLSYTEANSSKFGFTSNSARQAVASDYAKAMGCLCSGWYGGYWLRSIANYTTIGREVKADGSFDDTYFLMNNNKNYVGVRPVIKINQSFVEHFDEINNVDEYNFDIKIKAIMKKDEPNEADEYIDVDGAVVSVNVGDEIVAQSTSQNGIANFIFSNFKTLKYSMEYLRQNATVSAHLPIGNGLELCSETVDIYSGVWEGEKLNDIINSHTPLLVDEPRQLFEITVKYNKQCDISRIKNTFSEFVEVFANSTNGHGLIQKITYKKYADDNLLANDYISRYYSNNGEADYYVFNKMTKTMKTLPDKNLRYECDTAFSWVDRSIMVFDGDNVFFNPQDIMHESGHGLFGFRDEYCYGLGYYYDTNNDHETCRYDCHCTDTDNDGIVDHVDKDNSGCWGFGYLDRPIGDIHYGIMDFYPHNTIEMSTDSDYGNTVVLGDPTTQTCQYMQADGSCENHLANRFYNMCAIYETNYTRAIGIQDATYSLSSIDNVSVVEYSGYGYTFENNCAEINDSIENAEETIAYNRFSFDTTDSVLTIHIDSNDNCKMIVFDAETSTVEEVEPQISGNSYDFKFSYRPESKYHFSIIEGEKSKIEFDGSCYIDNNNHYWILSTVDSINHEDYVSLSDIYWVEKSENSNIDTWVSEIVNLSDNVNFEDVIWYDISNDIYEPQATKREYTEYNNFEYSLDVDKDGMFVLLGKKNDVILPNSISNCYNEKGAEDNNVTLSFSDSNSENLYYLAFSSDKPIKTIDEGNLYASCCSFNNIISIPGYFEYDKRYYISVLAKDKYGNSTIFLNCDTFYCSRTDSNNDGIPDSWFYDYYELSDSNTIAKEDNDKDGLTNLQEYQYGTNPLSPDTDGDNVYDTLEIWLHLNPLEQMTNDSTYDYIVAYGEPELYVDYSKILIDNSNGTVTFPIVNSAKGKAMRTHIYLYDSNDEIIEISEVNIDSFSTIYYSFDSSYLKDGIQIVLDEDHITHDSDYSNNEFVYRKANSIRFIGNEYTIIKGQTLKILPNTEPVDATIVYNWSIEPNGGFAIDSFGNITANSIGTATVTATTVEGLSASFTIKAVSFEGAEYSDFDTELTNGELTIINYAGSESTVNIPSELSGYPVTGISSSAFESDVITTINIPNSINTIELPAVSGTSSLNQINVAEGNEHYCSDDGVLFNKDKSVLIKYPSSKSGTNYVVPNTVTTIEQYAFDGCESLTSVDLNDVTVINDYAFNNSGLTSITIPEQMATLGYGVFYSCSELTNVIFNAVNCRADYSPTTTLQYAVSTDIYKKRHVFGAEVTNIIFGDKVEYIDNGIFAWVSASSINIPLSVSTVKSYAFYKDTALTDIYYAGSSKLWNEISKGTSTGLTGKTMHYSMYVASFYDADGEVIYQEDHYPGESIAEPNSPSKQYYSFQGWTPAVPEEMPEADINFYPVWERLSTVHDIYYYVDGELYDSFMRNEGEPVPVPDALPEKEGYTFNKWSPELPEEMPDTDLTFEAVFSKFETELIDGTLKIISYSDTLSRIEIPSIINGYPVTAIGDNAFNCTAETIVIPASITTISGTAFKNVSGLQSIEVDEANEYYSSDDGVLFNKDKTSLIRYPSGKPETKYSIPSTVTGIGQYAFYKCDNLSSVIIPNNVKTIGTYAFAYCNGIITLTIGEGITSIGNYAFRSCSSLDTLYYNAISCQSTGTYNILSAQNAFNSCSALKNVIIGNKVERIPNAFLAGITGVSEIIIPDNVTEIGTYSFYGCKGLKNITLSNSLKSIGNYAFYNCTFTNIELTDSVESIGTYTFANCTGLTNITIPAAVTSIGVSAFNGCSKLISITVDNENETYMSSDGVLFSKDGTNLIRCPVGKSGVYTVPDEVTTVGTYCFTGCKNLTVACKEGSPAHSFCVTNSIKYTFISSATNYSTNNKFAYNGHLYEIYNNEKSWKDAKAICEMLGGHLVTITASGEQTQVKNSVANGGKDYYWIGASDESSEGTWTWVTGDVFSYTSWGSGQPDNANSKEHYAEICKSDGTWNDNVFDATGKGFICEYDECETDFDFVVENNQITITGYNGNESDVIIPDTILGLPVTSINGTFSGCKFESVTLGVNVNTLSASAFSTCVTLQNIFVDDNNSTFVSENGILYSFDKTTIIKYPSAKSASYYSLPKSVTKINDYAFYNVASLKSINLSNVTRIEQYAFSNSGLTTATIPEGMEYLGKAAFYECTDLTDVFFNAVNCTSGYAPTIYILITKTSLIFDSTVKNVVFGDNVSVISSGLFTNVSLPKLYIPKSVKEIKACAFYYNSALTDVYYSGTEAEWNSVTKGNYAFGASNKYLQSATMHYGEYAATFIIDGKIVSQTGFTQGTTLKEPSIPAKQGYAYSMWYPYNTNADKNINIVARYELPHTTLLVQKTLFEGDSYRLLSSSNYTTSKKEWRSSDTRVATVDSSGKVTAIGEGECEIYVTCYGNDLTGEPISSTSSTTIIVVGENDTKEIDAKNNFKAGFENFFHYMLNDIVETIKMIFRYLAPFITVN